MVAVYESWGDLHFETYDPGVVCQLSLQVFRFEHWYFKVDVYCIAAMQ